jgi:membrane associated rhomboid family serine protease
MSDPPTGPSGSTLEESEETYCYGHPKTPTRLRCTRCDRPICGRCAIPASVGQHCPECVAEARKSAPKVRTAMMAAAPAVTAILAINIGVYVLQNLVPELTGRFSMQPLAIADGEWWRLFTPMVLHDEGRLLHILFNSLVLWIYGPHVERAFGTIRFVALYLISGFIGSVASFTFSPPFISGVGASGAIFGIAGVLLVYLYKRRSSSFVYAEMRNVVFFIGLNLLLGFLLPNIDYWAHIGGLVAGMALCLGFDRDKVDSSTEQPLASRMSNSLEVVTAVAVILVGVVAVVIRSGQLT